MSSKTFECMNPVVELTITKGSNGNINFIINHKLRGNTKATLEKSAGADAALAILEAAGHVRDACSDNDADVAMEWLHSAIARQAKQSAEAKEQAELEAEALELANSAVLVVGNPPYQSIGHMSDTSLRKWLAVARKAREMAKESTNGR